jgi:hypothetical protein
MEGGRIWCITYLDSGLDTLELDSLGLPNTVLLHVNQVARVAIQTPRSMALDVLGTQTGKHTDGAGTSVLGQCTGNNLHGIGDSLVGPLLDTLNGAGKLAKLHRNGHLNSTTTGGQTGVEDNVAGNRHGVLQVALNLVQDILGRTTQQNCAGLRGLALAHECEVLVTNLLNLKETAAGTNIGLLDVVDTVDDGGATGTGNTVVVGLPHTAEGCDVSLHQEVLCKI